MEVRIRYCRYKRRPWTSDVWNALFIFGNLKTVSYIYTHRLCNAMIERIPFIMKEEHIVMNTIIVANRSWKAQKIKLFINNHVK